MAKTIKYFANGIELTEVSADPVSPNEGDFQYSDGTARAKGVWQYKDGAWVSKGTSSVPDLASLGDTEDLTGQAGKFVKVNVTEDGFEYELASAVTDFESLTDTPASYTGNANKVVAVNTGETALEFITPSSSFTDLTDTPSDYVGHALKTVRVNGAGTGLDFIEGTSSELLGLENYSILSRNADNQSAASSFSTGKGTSFFVNDQGSASGVVGVYNSDAFLLSGTQSYVITSASANGSTGDWFALKDSSGSSTIRIDNVHRNQDIIFTFDCEYEGAGANKPEGLKAVIRDVTNSTVLSELDFVESVFIRSGRYELKATIPDSCRDIAVGFYYDGTSPVNAAGILVDNCYITRAPNTPVITEWVSEPAGINLRGTGVGRDLQYASATGSFNKLRWRRVGDSIECKVFYGRDNTYAGGLSSTVAPGGAEDWLVELPNGLKIDTAKCDVFTGTDGGDGLYAAGETVFEEISGYGHYDRSVQNWSTADIYIVPYSADGLRVFQRVHHQTNMFCWRTVSGPIPNTSPGDDLLYVFHFSVPVQGWS